MMFSRGLRWLPYVVGGRDSMRPGRCLSLRSWRRGLGCFDQPGAGSRLDVGGWSCPVALSSPGCRLYAPPCLGYPFPPGVVILSPSGVVMRSWPSLGWPWEVSKSRPIHPHKNISFSPIDKPNR